MPSGNTLSELIRGHKADHGVYGRPIFCTGDGEPDDITTIGWIYLRTGLGTSSEERIYLWNDSDQEWVQATVPETKTEATMPMTYTSREAGTPFSGTTETTLASIVLPADTLEAGSVVVMNAGFTVTPGALDQPKLTLRYKCLSTSNLSLGALKYQVVANQLIAVRSAFAVFTAGDGNTASQISWHDWVRGPANFPGGSLDDPHFTAVPVLGMQGEQPGVGFATSVPMTLYLTGQWDSTSLTPTSCICEYVMWQVYPPSGEVVVS